MIFSSLVNPGFVLIPDPVALSTDDTSRLASDRAFMLAHSNARAYKCTHARARTHTHTHTFGLTLISEDEGDTSLYICSYLCARTHAHTRVCPYIHARTHSYTHI